MSISTEPKCRHFPACRGCDHWNIPYSQQRATKLQAFGQTLRIESEMKKESFVSVKQFGLRHRFDFTFELKKDSQVMGFYGADHQLMDLEVCLQLAPSLQTVYEEFRRFQINRGAPSIKKGSVRLRVGPTGLKGCWLDLANVDIKALLDEGTFFKQMIEAGFIIEVGQKGKRIDITAKGLKLVDPQPEVWFQTKNSDGRNLTLRSLVSDFTQPSWLSAEKMVDVVLDWVHQLSPRRAIEFGPGIGQFTLPLLSKGIEVHAFENNLKAANVLQANAEQHGLQANLKMSTGDFQNKKPELVDEMHDLIFVNPPRSGLKNFVSTVIATQAPHCIYISCFPESMQTDIEKLKQAGYRVEDAKIVDQFPQTSHYESCVLLSRI